MKKERQGEAKVREEQVFTFQEEGEPSNFDERRLSSANGQAEPEAEDNEGGMYQQT
eukprot:CAMPEP_0170552058 /NCGR_PEP_ID=MMETSP0211-20121228/10034_1 /TAXON_ID=311385 /ORGANISM="Pseudokeronopsis sp., Strain OXSARD2" /LENGTH=55 /DNA_ID=CAMNT_0010859603 /DNA_START=1182 /DNA_END=1349 /DNA_ORIENTATION=-